MNRTLAFRPAKIADAAAFQGMFGAPHVLGVALEAALLSFFQDRTGDSLAQAEEKRDEMFPCALETLSQSALPSRAQSSWFKLQRTLPHFEESYRDCALAFPSGVVLADSLQSLKYGTAGDSCAASQYMLGTIWGSWKGSIAVFAGRAD